jgi:hypothetical protein
MLCQAALTTEQLAVAAGPVGSVPSADLAYIATTASSTYATEATTSSTMLLNSFTNAPYLTPVTLTTHLE